MKPITPPDSPASPERPAVMVVSHERSGTHFLMNTLAACFGYVSVPWIDFDHTSVRLNFYAPNNLRNKLLMLASEARTHIVKSHHQAGFFAGQLSRLAEHYVFFYIYRDPVDVLLSYWRFMHRWSWFEGPKVADPLTFARAEPCGYMMRYQLRQHANLMQRWSAHVGGWLEAAAAEPRVVLVRYEQLDTHFEEIIHGFARVLGCPPRTVLRPARDVNVIAGGPQDPSGRGLVPDVAALRALCRDTIGATMARLGY